MFNASTLVKVSELFVLIAIEKKIARRYKSTFFYLKIDDLENQQLEMKHNNNKIVQHVLVESLIFYSI